MWTWATASRWRLSAPGMQAVDAGKTMLSQWLKKQVNGGGILDSAACSADNHALSGRIWRVLTPSPSWAVRVP